MLLLELGLVGSKTPCITPAKVPTRFVPAGYGGPPLMANVCETVRTRQRREAKNAFTIRTLANRAPSRQRENKNGCAAQRETHFGAIPLSRTMTGSSSIMYWVLPITPHMGTPVAA